MAENTKQIKHIAVLMGGMSVEREVSLSSGDAVTLALRDLGYEVTQIDVAEDVAQRLSEVKPDLAFNALHGKYGEDGCIQGVLEILKIPYTHSGVLASALAMNKPAARHIFASHGLRIPDGLVLSAEQIKETPPFAFPFVVKPIDEGSSVGVSIISDIDELSAFINEYKPEAKLLAEEYIAGREIQVAVLNGKALGAIEIVAESDAGFYDYEAKYTIGKAQHIMPAPIDEADYNEVMQLAEKAHNALGCKGLTRADFRYDDTSLGEPLFYLLEVNTQPGMTALSLAPEIAAHSNITFNELVQKIVDSASI